MERQARFVLMGSFVLAFAVAIFGAVYWLHGIGNFRRDNDLYGSLSGGGPAE